MERSRFQSALLFCSLVLGAGALFPLPFLRQAYCDDMLRALHVRNTELGLMNSVYGFVALICYVPGGWLADRFRPKHLILVSLLGTGLSGLWFSTFPSLKVSIAIHAIWGVLCVLTFWAAMLKVTSAWGGEGHQGQAFGLLDGGRGLVEAVFALVAVAIFARYANPVEGLRWVIIFYSIACLLSAIGVAIFIPSSIAATPSNDAQKSVFTGDVLTVARYPLVWLVGLVIGCAYAAFWGTFDIPSYQSASFHGSPVAGAALGTFRMWFRPVAGLLVFYLASRVSKIKLMVWGFLFVAGGYLFLAFLPKQPDLVWLLWMDTAVLALFIFVMKGVYFALLTEGNVPPHLMGTAIGIVSLIGYLPDMLMPLIMGVLTDGFAGPTGHQILYIALAVASVAGVGATLAVGRLSFGGRDRVTVSECELPVS